MEKYSNYNAYLFKLKEVVEKGNKTTDIVFSGEWSVLNVVETYRPQGTFYCLELLHDEDMAILLAVNSTQESLRITRVCEWKFSIHKLVESLGIPESDTNSAVKWWNLCYYRDCDGAVFYDEYYNQFYASNVADKFMRDVHLKLQESVNSLFDNIIAGDVYLVGDFASFNPLIYTLQQLDFKVISASFDESPERDERLLRIKDDMIVPFCDKEVFTYSLFTNDGTVRIPAECEHPYVISLPIGDIDLNTKVLGNYTLNEMLPDGKTVNDYKCCGNEFMYLEQVLYADLFGNTFLRSINTKDSDSNQKTIVLNEFVFNN